MGRNNDNVVCRVMRGGMEESIHRGSIAIADVSGKVTASFGNPDFRTFFRSSAKPFQALAVIETRALGTFKFADREIAVMTGSHSGSMAHVDCVRGILSRAGLTENDLLCGYHVPGDAESQKKVTCGHEKPSPLFHNCSGKHAGMLSVCVAEGWPTAGYVAPDHPLQKLIRTIVSDCSSIHSESLEAGVDGCSAPAFRASLTEMATAFAQFGAAGGNGRNSSLKKIREAMTSFPEMVSGDGRFNTELMKRTSGKVVAKAGGEAVFCFAIPEKGIGVALKAEDGAQRAVDIMTVEVLFQLGVLTASEESLLGEFLRPKLKNHMGIEVGEIVPDFDLRKN